MYTLLEAQNLIEKHIQTLSLPDTPPELYEPVKYVENIRSYYDILRWHVDRETPRSKPNPIMAFSSPAL